MTTTQQLNARIATYRDPEARALIRYLIENETWSVANRLDMTSEQAVENVEQRILDFLADAETKLPTRA